MAPFPVDKFSLLKKLSADGQLKKVGVATAKRRGTNEFGNINSKILNKWSSVHASINASQSNQSVFKFYSTVIL